MAKWRSGGTVCPGVTVEVEISDRVMEKIQSGIEGDLRENRQTRGEPTEEDLQSVVASPLVVVLLKCGKQDLKLHGLAATRPSTVLTNFDTSPNTTT